MKEDQELGKAQFWTRILETTHQRSVSSGEIIGTWMELIPSLWVRPLLYGLDCAAVHCFSEQS